MKKNLLPISFLIIVCLTLFPACSPQAVSFARTSFPVRKQFFALDTLVTITLYRAEPACDTDAALSTAEDLCRQYENLFSKTIEGSDVWRINHSEGSPVKVSEETLYLIKKSCEYSRLTDGSFDITIAPVIDLWNSSESLPEESALSAALSCVSYKNIGIDAEEGTVTLKGGNADSLFPSIDLGAVAKGYIADQLKEFLKASGVTSALLDLGGNVLVLGEKAKNSPFHIAVKMPFTDTESFYTGQTLKKESIAATLDIMDLSVVTSGIYERYKEIDGRLYHHILDPQTGYPAENSLASVTIISERSLDGDLLSTSCLLSGEDKAKALVESLDSIEAVFIDKNGSVSFSSGIQKYLSR